MTRRAHLEIISEILSFCMKPKNKTKVMSHSNMSWKGFKKYLLMLESNGLLQGHNNPAKYSTTPKGMEFIKKWKEINELLKSDRI